MALMLQDVTIRRGQTPPLFAPLTLSVPAGQITTIIGASGVGKSTLLDFIGGHLAHGWIAKGQITLNGRDITTDPPETRRTGILFQDAVLFAHLSVADNLAFGLTPTIKGRAARRAAVEAALAQAGLAGFGPRDPETLSGGQKARVALMRTLLADPMALLLDEPFAKLDTDLRADIREFVFTHARARAIPVLMVTHDTSDAIAAAGPVVTLTNA